MNDDNKSKKTSCIPFEKMPTTLLFRGKDLRKDLFHFRACASNGAHDWDEGEGEEVGYTASP